MTEQDQGLKHPDIEQAGPSQFAFLEKIEDSELIGGSYLAKTAIEHRDCPSALKVYSDFLNETEQSIAVAKRILDKIEEVSGKPFFELSDEELLPYQLDFLDLSLNIVYRRMKQLPNYEEIKKGAIEQLEKWCMEDALD